MNRRTFLRTSAVSAASLALASRARLGATRTPPPPRPMPTAASAPLPDGFELLRRNVGIFNGKGGTIGWLSSPDALCVIDTQFPDTAAKCLAGLPGRGSRLIDVVINTHHHIDHTSGNPVFKPAAKCIVAHANVPALQRAASARMTPPTLDQQVYANMTFADSWNMTFPDETLHARHYGPAHTNGDIVIHFEKANIVHTGDLVFNRLYPVIDRIGGANIASWIKILETLHPIYSDDTRFIFGHGNPDPKFGPTGTRADLLTMRDYLTGLLDYTRKQIAAGKSKAEIITLAALPGFPDYQMANRLASNLDVAYDELTNAPIARYNQDSNSVYISAVVDEIIDGYPYWPEGAPPGTTLFGAETLKAVILKVAKTNDKISSDELIFFIDPRDGQLPRPLSIINAPVEFSISKECYAEAIYHDNASITRPYIFTGALDNLKSL